MGVAACSGGTFAFIITSKQVGQIYNYCAHFSHIPPCPQGCTKKTKLHLAHM